ncbi:MAG TPA: AraC family ligand binding domain-containing protein [Nitrospiria bacterium]
MNEPKEMVTFPNGVKLLKWRHKEEPTPDRVSDEMKQFGYKAYDLQTIDPWFSRSRHAHDYTEIRGAVSGVTTFHFDDFPVTIEGGDILIIPGGMAHEVVSHNGRPFSAYKGSMTGERKVTELGDGRGSVEDVAKRARGEK